MSIRDQAFDDPSLPRLNGSPVFYAPWQARAHAMAVLTVEATSRSWDDFRTYLVDAIATSPSLDYWDNWVSALECLAADVVQ